MPEQDDLAASRAKLEQAADNLLSDLQCPHEQFVWLVARYLAASEQYARGLAVSAEAASPEIAEAYSEEARFFWDQTQLITLLYGYRKRLGFGEPRESSGETPAEDR